MIEKEMKFLYTRSEATNKYTLFLNVDKSILEQEIDINLEDDKTISIKAIGSDLPTYKSQFLGDEIYDILSTKKVLTVFTDDNGEFLSSFELDLIKHDSIPTTKKKRI